MSEPTYTAADLGVLTGMTAVDLGGQTVVSTTPVVAGPRGPVGPAGPGGEDISAHLADPTPHAVYDDLPSLTLLLENGLI